MQSKDRESCDYWAEKLAASHQKDLSFEDRIALNKHVTSCPTCTATYAAYKAIEAHIRALPPVESLPSLVPQLLEIAQEKENQIGVFDVKKESLRNVETTTHGSSLGQRRTFSPKKTTIGATQGILSHSMRPGKAILLASVTCVAVLLYLFVPTWALLNIFLIFFGVLILMWGVIMLDDQIHHYRMKRMERDATLQRYRLEHSLMMARRMRNARHRKPF